MKIMMTSLLSDCQPHRALMDRLLHWHPKILFDVTVVSDPQSKCYAGYVEGIVACRIQRCDARFQRVLAPQMYRTQSAPLASVANFHASVDSTAMDGNSKVCLRNIHRRSDLQSAASRREYGSIRASNIYHGKALVQTALPGLFGSTSLQKVLREGGNQGYTRQGRSRPWFFLD